jgi:hypothetical protein
MGGRLTTLCVARGEPVFARGQAGATGSRETSRMSRGPGAAEAAGAATGMAESEAKPGMGGGIGRKPVVEELAVVVGWRLMLGMEALVGRDAAVAGAGAMGGVTLA